MKLRKLRKLAQAKLGWPVTYSDRTEIGGYDPYTGIKYPKRTARFSVSSWGRAQWKGKAA